MNIDDINIPNLANIAGVDEAGRGPLAGPVITAAVILPSEYCLPNLGDSKKLSGSQRAKLYTEITDQAVAWAVGRAEPDEIDELNILWATMLAMKRAVESLNVAPSHVLVDGNRCPDIDVSSQAVIKGDTFVDCISAASIIAKQSRDREMLEFDQEFPEYGFASHKGYPTKKHLAALADHGICRIHRKSYKPVKIYL